MYFNYKFYFSSLDCFFKTLLPDLRPRNFLVKISVAALEFLQEVSIVRHVVFQVPSTYLPTILLQVIQNSATVVLILDFKNWIGIKPIQ